MSAVEVLDTGQQSVAELARTLSDQLRQWHEHAMALWEVTAQIGATLKRAYDQVGGEAWSEWLDGLGLTPYTAFLFMRAERYPKLMREDKPANLEAIARLLPQGQGTAYDFEQGALARRLFEGGLSKRALRQRFGVGPLTIERWVDPERYEQVSARKRENERRRLERRDEERARRRAAAMKAKGGPSALAYEHLRKAQLALDEAYRASAGEKRNLLNEALAASYRVEEKIGEAHGIQ